MSNKLENYIKEHRNEFDSIEPSGKLWQNINSSVQQPGFFAGKASWLKYFLFGASAITVITYLSLNTNNSANSQSLGQTLKNDSTLLEIPEVQNSIENTYAEKPENYIVPVKNILSFIPSPIQNEEITETINEEKNIPIPFYAVPNSPSSEIPMRHPNTFYEMGEPKKNIWQEKDNILKVDTAFSGIKAIEVNTNGFDINIKSNSDDKVFFRADLKKITKGLIIGKNKHRINYTIKDSILSINVACTNNDVIFFGVYSEEASLDFDLPKSTNIKINNSYGDINAEGLQGKIVDIQTHSGDIKVENISTNLTLKTGYGNVKATDIRGNIIAKIASGDLKINKLDGNLDIKTSYGNQSYQNINGNIKLATSSGDVKITEMNGDIDVASSYGNIDMENFKGSASIRSSSGDIKGKNVALTAFLTVTSSYGNVKMDLVNEPSDLSFDLKTKYGKISCDMYEKKLEAEHELLINKGKIQVKGNTHSGDQSYR